MLRQEEPSEEGPLRITGVQGLVVLDLIFLAVASICQNNRQQTSTYNDNDEVEASPDASKVSPETKCDPLEKHLDCEEDGKDKVDNLEDEFQLLIVLQVDIFKAERQTANMGY